MEFRSSYRTITQSHVGKPLALSPPAVPIELSETRQFTNGLPHRERFYAGKLAADFEEHQCQF